MKTTRRQFVQVAGTGALGAALDPVQAPVLRGRDSGFDVAVVGAGVFGVWTAYQLQLTGRRVALIDAYGPANARGSSGGQSRVIRMGYGDQEIYTRWSMRSLDLWQALLRRTGRAAQFQRSGVLWMAREQDPLTTSTLETLGRLRVRHERLDRSNLAGQRVADSEGHGGLPGGRPSVGQGRAAGVHATGRRHSARFLGRAPNAAGSGSLSLQRPRS